VSLCLRVSVLRNQLWRYGERHYRNPLSLIDSFLSLLESLSVSLCLRVSVLRNRLWRYGERHYRNPLSLIDSFLILLFYFSVSFDQLIQFILQLIHLSAEPFL